MGGGESTPASEPNVEMGRWKERNRMREEEEAEERERVSQPCLHSIKTVSVIHYHRQTLPRIHPLPPLSLQLAH